MNRFTLTLILVLIVTICNAQLNKEISIGQFESYDSKIYQKNRELYIYLPESYSESAKSYPVLYLLFPHSSFYRTRTAYGYLAARKRIPEAIIIGIVNADDRAEIFPFKVDQFLTSGGADQFIQSIKTEVIPFVDSNYRTDSTRVLGGFSNSAMFATYLMIEQPDLFDSFILSSPMLGWGDYILLDKFEKYINENNHLNKTIYITYGEDDYEYVTKSIPRLELILRDKAPKGLNWRIDVVENEGHIPYIDSYNGLLFTFRERKEK